MPRHSKISLLAASLLLASTLLPVFGAQPAPSANRFLFIIDTSSAMKPLVEPLRENIFDLIYSGLRGQMTNGDSYGLWLVDGHNDTTFPMEIWQYAKRTDQAMKASSFVKEHGLKGQVRLDAALADARRVIKKISDLTVVVVSNGDTPITGTPFDTEINARWRELAPAMKTAKATLHTTLVSRHGEFAGWAVNSPDYLVEMPALPPRPQPEKMEPPAPAPEPAKIAAAPIEASTAPAPVAKARVSVAPIIITKQSVAQERLSYLTGTAMVDPAPAVAVAATNAAAAVVSSVEATNVANGTNVTVASAPPVVSPTAVTNSTPVVASVPATTESSAATNNLALGTHAAPPAASGTGEVRETAANHGLWWAAGGAAVAFLLAFIAFRVLRRREPEVSLISQSLARSPLNPN